MTRLLSLALVLGFATGVSYADEKDKPGAKNAEKILGNWKLLKIDDKSEKEAKFIEFWKDKNCKISKKEKDKENSMTGTYEFVDENAVKITMQTPDGERSKEFKIEKLTEEVLIMVENGKESKERTEFERVKGEKKEDKKEEKKEDEKK